MWSAPRERLSDMQDRHAQLRSAIENSGYYPDVVADGVDGAVAREAVVSYLVHHEPTIDRDEVRRHVTVLVLTPSRLIVAHTDEHAPDDLLPAPYTSTSTEAVMLSNVRSVVVNRMVANPASYAGKPVPPPGANEVVLTIGWGGVGRVDLEPAGCSDPQCDADHGYTGVVGLRRLLDPGQRRGRRRRRRRRRPRRSPRRSPRATGRHPADRDERGVRPPGLPRPVAR